jgi:hypothetical protein
VDGENDDNVYATRFGSSPNEAEFEETKPAVGTGGAPPVPEGMQGQNVPPPPPRTGNFVPPIGFVTQVPVTTTFTPAKTEQRSEYRGGGSGGSARDYNYYLLNATSMSVLPKELFGTICSMIEDQVKSMDKVDISKENVYDVLKWLMSTKHMSKYDYPSADESKRRTRRKPKKKDIVRICSAGSRYGLLILREFMDERILKGKLIYQSSYVGLARQAVQICLSLSEETKRFVIGVSGKYEVDGSPSVALVHDTFPKGSNSAIEKYKGAIVRYQTLRENILFQEMNEIEAPDLPRENETLEAFAHRTWMNSCCFPPAETRENPPQPKAMSHGEYPYLQKDRMREREAPRVQPTARTRVFTPMIGSMSKKPKIAVDYGAKENFS